MKIKCTQCKIEKELNEENFYKYHKHRDGWRLECKICATERSTRNNKKKQETDSWWNNIIG
jgi:hypothetical protein